MNKLIAFGLLLPFSATFGAINLLVDDFNDGSIDPNKWNTTLVNGNSSVSEQSGYLTTQSRGILSSVDDITGAYSISGSVALQDGFEQFKVAFRSDLSASGSFGERNGMLAVFSNDGDQLAILRINNGDHTIIAQKSYTLNTGQFYDFELIDYGNSIAFLIDGVEELTTSDNFSAGNKIGFYSREFASTSSDIDFISVSTVPEPTTFALAVGLACLITMGRRRR